MTPEADRMLNPERPPERLEEKAARLEAAQRKAGTEPPSALLRRAADRLDELAGAVAVADVPDDLPWHVEEGASEERGDCPCIVAQGWHSDGAAPPVAMFYVADAETPELAAYIAAVDPSAGRAFASVLRAAAAMAQGGSESDGIGIVHYAMAAARRILGEAA